MLRSAYPLTAALSGSGSGSVDARSEVVGVGVEPVPQFQSDALLVTGCEEDGPRRA
jgi:hypothetical protein